MTLFPGLQSGKYVTNQLLISSQFAVWEMCGGLVLHLGEAFGVAASAVSKQALEQRDMSAS
jgi:hypothetical protein